MYMVEWFICSEYYHISAYYVKWYEASLDLSVTMLVAPELVSDTENATDKEKPKTEYEQMLWKMQHDSRWLKEVSLGKRVGWYRFSETIGCGNFSQVKLAVHSLTRDQVAVKIIDKTKLGVKTRKMVTQEIKSMEAVYHPNIIRLLEVMDTYRKLYLVLEYAPGGQLYDLITSGGALTSARAMHYMVQVAKALSHMHNLGYVHRDIKAENVFVSCNDIVKLGDFGFSSHLKDDPNAKLNTFCGSPPYAAPELFCDANYTGPPVDVWAFGVLLYFLLTASFPFHGDSVGQLKSAILKGQFDIPNYLTAPCKHIIENTLTQKSDDRLTMSEIIASEWFTTPQTNRNNVRKSSLTQIAKKLHLSHDKRSNEGRRKTLLKGVPEIIKSNKTADVSSRPAKCGDHRTDSHASSASTGLGGSFEIGDLPSTRPDHMLMSSDARFVMWPSGTVETGGLSAVERRARESLARLGVGASALLQQAAGGARSPLVGAYRCIVTRILHEQLVWDSLADAALQPPVARRPPPRNTPPRFPCCTGCACVIF